MIRFNANANQRNNYHMSAVHKIYAFDLVIETIRQFYQIVYRTFEI